MLCVMTRSGKANDNNDDGKKGKTNGSGEQRGCIIVMTNAMTKYHLDVLLVMSLKL